MIKKCLSGIIAVSLSSVIIPANIMANESSLSIKTFNATASVITVDFNNVTNKLDEDSFDDKIIVRERSVDDGERVLDESEFSVVTTGEVAGDENTVVIKPVEGLDTSNLYRVEFLSGISDSDGTTLNEKESTGWFKVNQVYFDDFNVSYEDNGTTPKEPIYKDGNATKSRYWEADYDGTNTGILGNKLQIRNATRYAVLNKTGLPVDKQVSDYTVEYQLGLSQNGYYKIPQYIAMRNSELRTRNDPLYYVGRSGYLIGVDKDYNYSDNTGSLFIRVGNISNDPLVKVSGYQFNGKTVEVRAVAEGERLQYYIDDDKVFDIIDSTYNAKSTIGFAGGCAWNESPPTTMDNLSITTVTKYGENLPELTVEETYAKDLAIYIVLSEDVLKEKVEGYITFKNEDGEDIEFSMDAEENLVILTLNSALEDGRYIVTLKENMASEEMSVISNDYQLGFECVGGDISNIPISKPEISNLYAEVLNKKFSIDYDYVGENDNASEYYVYSSKVADGNFTEIASGILTEDELSIDVNDEFVDCYLKVKVIPKDNKGYINNKIETEAFKGMFTPQISDVKLEDNFESGSIKIISYEFYDENGDTDLSEIKWFASDEMDGEYMPVEGAIGAELEIDDVLRDKFVKAYITPKTDTYPYEGEIYITEYLCRTYEPEAKDVKITGEATIGEDVTAEYTYFDKNQKKGEPSTESGTTFRWLIADSIDGDYVEIEEETGKSITIKNEYADKFLKVEITPKKAEMTGFAVLSDAFILPSSPEVKNVKISGTVKEGYLVSGVYEYQHKNNVAEGESKFKWYVDGEVVSEEKNYTIKKSDAGKKICFEVTPVAVKEPCEGKAVKSEEKTIEKKKSTSSGSGGGGSYGGSIGSGTIVTQIQTDINKVQENQNVLITNFKDVGESLYQKEIVELYDKGIIKGVSETEFCPEREITRAEFVTLMVRFLGINIAEYENIFNDVSKEDWYADNIQTAYNSKFIEGYAGSFRPNDGIKIEEILKILVEVYEKDGAMVEVGEENFKNVSEWAVEYAAKSKEMGLINDDKEFTLNEKAARDEAAALISRFLEKAGESK